MAHFYGTVEGAASTKATRTGTKKIGLTTHAAGWSGAVRVDVFNKNGEDHYTVNMVRWHGAGESFEIATGIIGKEAK